MKNFVLDRTLTLSTKFTAFTKCFFPLPSGEGGCVGELVSRTQAGEGSIRNAAFTLAEILITLAIIGIVAILTIPNLINNYSEKETVTKLKKIYSVLNNAYRLAEVENGPITSWFDNEAEMYQKDEAGNIIRNDKGESLVTNEYKQANDIIASKFKQYLNVTKDCGHDTGCFSDELHYLQGENTINLINYQQNTRYFLALNDGTFIGFLRDGIYVDVNGFKGPNTIGKDVFQFDLSYKGVNIYPHEDTLECYTNNWICSNWVLTYENLDYLHCDDLSWSGKHKCSE